MQASDEGRPDGGGRVRVIVAGVAVLLMLAGVVGVGWSLQQWSDAEDLPPSIPVVEPSVDFSTRVEAGVVTAGDADAPVTIDIYEDFLCSACGRLDENFGERLEQAIAGERARVRFHLVATDDGGSVPPGYSSLAAAAGACAAEHGIFPAFHRSLFHTQPVEGGPAWTRPQLIQLGRDLGAGEEFAACARETDAAEVGEWTGVAAAEVSELRPDGGLATPTVLVDGDLVDLTDGDWLAQALAGDTG